MASTSIKHTARLRRKEHIRKTVRGTPEQPRLCVFRSWKHI
jgi:large subunit ribosomal protein L18